MSLTREHFAKFVNHVLYRKPQEECDNIVRAGICNTRGDNVFLGVELFGNRVIGVELGKKQLDEYISNNYLPRYDKKTHDEKAYKAAIEPEYRRIVGKLAREIVLYGNRVFGVPTTFVRVDAGAGAGAAGKAGADAAGMAGADAAGMAGAGMAGAPSNPTPQTTTAAMSSAAAVLPVQPLMFMSSVSRAAGATAGGAIAAPASVAPTPTPTPTPAVAAAPASVAPTPTPTPAPASVAPASVASTAAPAAQAARKKHRRRRR